MDPIQDLDLITTVDLSYKGDGKKPVYHFIYASQLYGTLFSIYAKFDGTDKGTTFEISKITMRLINYKGVINVGFTDDFVAQDNLMNGWSIDFGVKGAISDVEKIKPLQIVLTKGVPIPLTFNRTLHPLTAFGGLRSSPVGARGRMASEPPTTDLFDSEFFERDGVDFYKHEPKEGMEGHQPPPPLGPFITGPRCIQSNVSLRF